MPKVVNAERKSICRESLRQFCETYFPETFYFEWSEYHLEVIDALEQTILKGGKFALAMPRGSGKTTLCTKAAEWAMFYGYRKYLLVVGAGEPSAREILETIKGDLEKNDLLLEDFPEVCYPIRALESIVNRCKGQTFEGKPTSIKWTADCLQLPAIKGSEGSGARVEVAGIMGHIRGRIYRGPDGRPVRPNLVLIDDPQTHQTADSPSTTWKREQIINADIMGLCGAGETMSALMTCTVISPGDLADRFLTNKQYATWTQKRFQLMESLPKNETLWEEYNRIRQESLDEATAFYRRNRKKMDAGAKVAWADNYTDGELSAIQHAMNLKLENETAFWSEQQNAPKKGDETSRILPAEEIARKLNGFQQNQAPPDTEKITSFVDVHGDVLYYAIAAWAPGFSGWVLDYGAWPRQKREYFRKRDAKATLRRKYQGAGTEGAVVAGIVDLLTWMTSQAWPRGDGSHLSIDRVFVDSGWLDDAVMTAIRKVPLGERVATPTKGMAVKATNKPFSEYRKERGERRGKGWRMPKARKREMRKVIIDTNLYKSFLHARLSAYLGDPGGLTFWGKDPERHRCISEHLTAEKPVPVEANGRRIDEWFLPPSQPDNHWFDCLVGCCAAANFEGVWLPTDTPVETPKKPKPRIRFK
jgi:hypothetical protein